MKPEFRIDQRDNFWTVEIFYIATEDNQPFDDWAGFEEPFNEEVYQKMTSWCYSTFKTYIWPKRARRMSYNQFWFKRRKDLDWFILHWSSIDI